MLTLTPEIWEMSWVAVQALTKGLPTPSHTSQSILHCLLLGSYQHLFPVSIDAKETVGALKKVIKHKKEPNLNDIAADKLTVYKVLIPDDDGLSLALDNL